MKKWYPAQQPEEVNLAEQVDEHILTEDVPIWQSATIDKVRIPTFGKHLTTKEQSNLNDLLEEFEDVLIIKPGKTNLIKHHIVTSTKKPIKLPPYRVPQAYQVMVRQKIKEMLNQGIIEPSVSKWASPIVPILKKMGLLDYVQIINALMLFHRPMPIQCQG